jgi:hypothetical protein
MDPRKEDIPLYTRDTMVVYICIGTVRDKDRGG